jgi:hypothetical protein
VEYALLEKRFNDFYVAGDAELCGPPLKSLVHPHVYDWKRTVPWKQTRPATVDEMLANKQPPMERVVNPPGEPRLSAAQWRRRDRTPFVVDAHIAREKFVLEQRGIPISLERKKNWEAQKRLATWLEENAGLQNPGHRKFTEQTRKAMEEYERELRQQTDNTRLQEPRAKRPTEDEEFLALVVRRELRPAVIGLHERIARLEGAIADGVDLHGPNQFMRLHGLGSVRVPAPSN